MFTIFSSSQFSCITILLVEMSDTQTTKRKTSSPIPISPFLKKGPRFEPTLDPDFYLKYMNEPNVFDMMKDEQATVSIKTVADGLFKIIYINKAGTDKDAFDWPLYRAIQTYGHTTKLRGDAKFLEKFTFIASAPRRLSRDKNEPRYSDSTKKNTNVRYKQKCYIVRMKWDYERESFEILQHIATVSRSSAFLFNIVRQCLTNC